MHGQRRSARSRRESITVEQPFEGCDGVLEHADGLFGSGDAPVRVGGEVGTAKHIRLVEDRGEPVEGRVGVAGPERELGKAEVDLRGVVGRAAAAGLEVLGGASEQH